MDKSCKETGSLAQEIEKKIKTDSFFTFLDPPAVKESGKMENHDNILAVDFNVGFPVKEKVTLQAVLFFTGDIFGEDEEEEDEDISKLDILLEERLMILPQ